jgi:hypothetical protein
MAIARRAKPGVHGVSGTFADGAAAVAHTSCGATGVSAGRAGTAWIPASVTVIVCELVLP